VKIFFENWNKFLNEENENNLNNWQYEDAKSYAEELIEQYGDPDVMTNNMVLWKDNKISEFKKVYVLDESIPHDSPRPHHDFVYSTMEIDVPQELMEAVAKASESIIVDQLKNEVTARCGDIFANAITLGFVQKLIEGEIKPEDAEEEYKKHILEGMTPDWFKEELDEGKICAKGVAWAKRNYDKWPSAYASMGASKYCKDPSYGKDKKKKKNEEVKDTYGDEIVQRNKKNREKGSKDLLQKEGELAKWRAEKWVQSDGTPCGDAKAQKNPKRCKPASKWSTMSKSEKAADNAKKKKGGKKGKQFVSATKKGKVTKGHTKESLKMRITQTKLKDIIKEEVSNILNEKCWDGYEQKGMKKKGDKTVPNCVPVQEKQYYEVDALNENEEYCPVCVKEQQVEEEKKKACKPSKGKRFAKRVDGKCRSFGQAGQAKSGGDRIRPGTAKGDAYCARSAKIKKCKNPPCANTLSRKKWKCKGSKSVPE
jgi:hypothetical protein